MKQNQRTDLKDRICALSLKQEDDLTALRAQAKLTYESLKPLNQLKKGWDDLVASKSNSGDIVGGIAGLSIGYLSKKVLVGSSHNPIKIILGTVAQFAVAKVVSHYGETIKTKGQSWLTELFSKKNKRESEFAVR